MNSTKILIENIWIENSVTFGSYPILHHRQNLDANNGNIRRNSMEGTDYPKLE